MANGQSPIPNLLYHILILSLDFIVSKYDTIPIMLVVSLNSKVPVADQILNGIRCAIAAGELEPGDELPPVRQLASDLGVNLNTVARAYRALEAAGLVSTARGRGTHVTASRETSAETKAQRTQRITDAVRLAITDARLAGLTENEATKLINAQLGAFYNGGAS